MGSYCASAQSYTRAQAASLPPEHLQHRSSGARGEAVLPRPLPPLPVRLPISCPRSPVDHLWVGLMGRTKERLTGSEWYSNLMCIKVPRGLIKAPLAPPIPQLLISLGLGGAWEFSFQQVPRWGCCCSGGHTLRTTGLEAQVQLQKKVSSGVTVCGILWNTSES